MIVTADLYDQHGNDVDSCELQFTQYGAVEMFQGRIRTIRCLNDNVLIKNIVQETVEGDVLVVDAGGYLGAAVMGDNIANLAKEHGWAGVIINGAIRDAKIMKQISIGVKALGTNPRKTSKKGEGQVDIPVAFGGVVFTPGHVVYSDGDGIITSARKLV